MTDALDKIGRSDDAADLKLRNMNAELRGEQQAGGINLLGCVNLKPTTKVSRPRSIFDIFVAGNDEPRPGLSDAESFHRSIVARLRTAATIGLI